MKICVIAGSLYIASETVYGSESMSAQLADALGGMQDEVTLLAAPQSQEGKYKLVHMPCTYGQISLEAESFPYDEYPELLLDSDLILDRSATQRTAEDLWFFENREWVEHRVICYSSGGWATPREPVRTKLHYVAVSQIHKQHGIEKGLDGAKIHIIPYGIDGELYCPDYGSKEDFALYVGAPRQEKGIMAILGIAKRMPDQQFVLAWRVFSDVHKEADREFREKLKCMGLKNVRYQELSDGEKGLKEKIRLYQQAKCFLQPSSKDYCEYLGLTTLESLSCGTPVIRESWGSSPEVIESGVHGFLCNEIDDYIRSIKVVDKIDPHECRKLIEDLYTKERYASDHLALFEELNP